MSTTTQPKFVGDVLVHEISQPYTRDKAILAIGSASQIGAVMGRIFLGAATSAAKAGGNTGTGTLTLDATAPVQAGAKRGAYAVRMLTATTFRVEDPDGFVLGDGANGTAFVDDLKFVIAAGGTAFVAGDGFDITVADGSDQVVPLDLTAVNGAQIPDSISLETKAVSAAVQPLEIAARACCVDTYFLVWPAGATDAQKATALATLKAKGIVPRTSL